MKRARKKQAPPPITIPPVNVALPRPSPRPVSPPPFPLCSPTDALVSPPPLSRSRLQWLSEIPLKPTTPRPWTWTCHICGHSYRLGVTRRCLRDGHYFCTGRPAATPRGKRPRKRRACDSEFDYVGWEETNQWRRQVKAAKAAREGMAPDPLPSPTRGIRNCWERCVFPTACRISGAWGGPLSPPSPDGGDIPPEGDAKRRKVEKE